MAEWISTTPRVTAMGYAKPQTNRGSHLRDYTRYEDGRMSRHLEVADALVHEHKSVQSDVACRRGVASLGPREAILSLCFLDHAERLSGDLEKLEMKNFQLVGYRHHKKIKYKLVV